jgi:alkanesulfonate monooxygenase SsuD/methylene tetrahydromethanopterin reductase-like flavin-dependent oxidoreductase (luciferase family)
VRLGVVILPEHPWAQAQELWERAEEIGFDHAWTYDHLAWRSLRDSTWFATMPTLAAAALSTTTMRIGTLVASPNVREPVALARDVITLDDMSGGRFTLGIGAGGAGWDATMLGQPPLSAAERADRLEEFVQLSDLLLRDPPVDFEGWHYSAIDVPMAPGCVQQPRVPFAIAATGGRGMRLAAEHAEVWVTNGAGSFDESLTAAEGARVVAEQSVRLDAECAGVDRDPGTIDRLVLLGFQLQPQLDSAESFRDLIGHYAAVGVTDLVVHWPRPSEPFAGDRDTFERVVAEVTGA